MKDWTSRQLQNLNSDAKKYTNTNIHFNHPTIQQGLVEHIYSGQWNILKGHT